MKSFFLRMVLWVLLMGPVLVWAQEEPTTDGKLSEQLAANLYCSAGDLLQGNLGLILGLFLVFLGIWNLIQGGKLMGSLPLIFVGAAIPMLPSIIEASFMGLGTLLSEAKISSSTKGFDPPSCSDVVIPDWSENNIESCPQSGGFYPGKAGCSKLSADPTPGKAGR